MDQLTENKNSDTPEPLPSDRSWGLTLAVVCFVIAIWNHSHFKFSSIFGATGLILFAFALLSPTHLHPLNQKWMAFSHRLSRFTNPLLMGATFLLVITPLAVLARLLGKRFLQLEREPDRDTYWISRTNGQIEPESLKRLF